MAQINIADAMGKLPGPLAPEQPLHDVLDRFTNERADALPVIDADGVLLGVITATDIEQAITNPRDGLSARSLAREVPEIRADQSLEDAVRALATTDQEGLPVLDSDGENVIGWLTHRRILRAYHAHLNTND